MSPEQCLGQKVGAASDLYSVGVLLYEMLAGRPPFVDTLSSAVLVKQATVQPPPLLSLRPDVPRSLAAAVHTLLAKNPAHRPASATEARRMLERSVEPERRAAGFESVPFASTVAALNAGRYAFTRVATLFTILLMVCAVLVVWSASAGQEAAREGALKEAGRDPAAFSYSLVPRATRARPRRRAHQ